MLYIGENLGSLNAAIEYNKSKYTPLMKDIPRGCLSSLACEHCYHVIHDSICMCAGFPKVCPNCNFEKTTIYFQESGTLI
jgi:hypothetical protein